MKEKHVFDGSGLDQDDEMIGWFVATASVAVTKLQVAIKEEKSPALAFNEFVKAWEFYSILPDSAQAQCEEFFEPFKELWNDVAQEEADYFRFLCDAVRRGEKEAEDHLSIVCLEIMDAIVIMDGSIPEVTSIYVAAMNTAKSGAVCSNACVALLYILSARVWYRSYGYSSDVEEALLSDGIRYHMNVTASDLVCITELYAIHIVAAIDDIICVRSERGVSREEVLMLAKEGYTVLARFDSPQVDYARQSLYNSSGISAEMALYGERRYSLPPLSGKKRMGN